MNGEQLRAALDAALVSVSAALREAERLAGGIAPEQAALAAGGVCAAILMLTGGVWAYRRLARRAGRGGGRAGQVRALARRGLAAAEIARRTGLSRDAVEMLLAAAPAGRDRPNLPESARIAAPRPRPGWRVPASHPFAAK